MEEEKNLGLRIMEYRAMHDLTQTEFAEKVGLTKLTIGNIERGGKASKITELKIIMFLNKNKEE